MKEWTGEMFETVKDPPANGDIYWNPMFGDLWVTDGTDFVKINDGYRTEIENTVDFVKCGHLDIEVKVTTREEKDELLRLCRQRLSMDPESYRS